jgi:hypothetical protein
MNDIVYGIFVNLVSSRTPSLAIEGGKRRITGKGKERGRKRGIGHRRIEA